MLAPLQPRFGCKLTISLPSGVRTFSIEATCPSKKEAKATAARKAIEAGLLRELRQPSSADLSHRSSTPSSSQTAVPMAPIGALDPPSASREPRSPAPFQPAGGLHEGIPFSAQSVLSDNSGSLVSSIIELHNRGRFFRQNFVLVPPQHVQQ